jgi:phenylpyruvate tautomerase PptA (4-oxalocrotonate tautomerase family)
MPLVTIDVLKGRPPEEVEAISDAVHEAMVELLDVPVRDRFQIVTQQGPDTLRFDRHYLDIERSDRFVLVTITLAAGRSTDTKRAFYRHLADLLAERVGLRPEDLAVTLIENQREDWSFGNGLASYLELPREAWR